MINPPLSIWLFPVSLISISIRMIDTSHTLYGMVHIHRTLIVDTTSRYAMQCARAHFEYETYAEDDIYNVLSKTKNDWHFLSIWPSEVVEAWHVQLHFLLRASARDCHRRYYMVGYSVHPYPVINWCNVHRMVGNYATLAATGRLYSIDLLIRCLSQTQFYLYMIILLCYRRRYAQYGARNLPGSPGYIWSIDITLSYSSSFKRSLPCQDLELMKCECSAKRRNDDDYDEQVWFF